MRFLLETTGSLDLASTELDARSDCGDGHLTERLARVFVRETDGFQGQVRDTGDGTYGRDDHRARKTAAVLFLVRLGDGGVFEEISFVGSLDKRFLLSGVKRWERALDVEDG